MHSEEWLYLKIFRGDPLLRYLKEKESDGRRLLYSVIILCISSLAVGAAIDGMLPQKDFLVYWCADATHYIGAKKHYCNVSSADTMPLLRDIPTLLLAIVLSATPFLAYRQWLAISKIFSDLDRQNLLLFLDETYVRNEFDKANKFFYTWRRRNPAIMAITMFCMLFVNNGLSKGELFPNVGNIAYQYWWPHIGNYSWVTFSFWAAVFIYVIIIQNFYGGRVIYLLWRIRSLIRVDLNIYATDAFYGWGKIVATLRCTWSTLLIHGISLFLISLALPSFLGVWMAPLFVQWIVTLPLYTLLPISVMSSNKKRWQKEKLEELQCKSEQESSQQTEWRAQQISEAAKLIREVSVNPIKGFVPTMLVTSATLVTLWSVAKAIINLYS